MRQPSSSPPPPLLPPPLAQLLLPVARPRCCWCPLRLLCLVLWRMLLAWLPVVRLVAPQRLPECGRLQLPPRPSWQAYRPPRCGAPAAPAELAAPAEAGSPPPLNPPPWAAPLQEPRWDCLPQVQCPPAAKLQLLHHHPARYLSAAAWRRPAPPLLQLPGVAHLGVANLLPLAPRQVAAPR